MIAHEFLRCLENCEEWQKRLKSGDEIVLADVGKEGVRSGYTARLRVPQPFEPFTIRDILETHILVTLDQQFHFDVDVDPSDFHFSLDAFRKRYLESWATLMAKAIIDRWPIGSTLVSAPLELPAGVQAAYFSARGNLSIRVVLMDDLYRGVRTLRFDILFGTTIVLYQPSAFELELIALLQEARAELVRELEEFRMAA